MGLHFRGFMRRYREQTAKNKAARDAIKADKKAHPEKHKLRNVLANAREMDRRRYTPTADELEYLAENTSVIYVARASMPLVGYLRFDVAGPNTYVSLNGFLFHEVTGLPKEISRDFAREMASMGHEGQDGTWKSPVTGLQYGSVWRDVDLMKPGNRYPGQFQGASGPQVKTIDQYVVGQSAASGPMEPADIALVKHLPGQILQRVTNYAV
jgi:hypothetical protein